MDKMKEKEAKAACDLNALNKARDEFERLADYYDDAYVEAKRNGEIDARADGMADAYRDAMRIVDEAKAHYIQNFDDRGWIRAVDRLPNQYERKRSCDGVFGSQFIVIIEKADIPTSLFLTEDNRWTDGRFDPRTGELTEYSVAWWREFPVLPKIRCPF